jgi:hypothetical protein
MRTESLDDGLMYSCMPLSKGQKDLGKLICQYHHLVPIGYSTHMELDQPKPLQLNSKRTPLPQLLIPVSEIHKKTIMCKNICYTKSL